MLNVLTTHRRVRIARVARPRTRRHGPSIMQIAIFIVLSLAWEQGFEHHVWPVNCVETGERFAKLGTTSIITDVPQTLREHFQSK